MIVKNLREVGASSFVFDPTTREIHVHPEYTTEVDKKHRRKGIVSEMYCFV
jgi:hypothetical protein